MASTQTTIYPQQEQYERWKQQAEAMDRSVSSWIADMVEAGNKKFTAEVEPDETRQQLREERNELRSELESARERIEKLEEHAEDRERRAVESFLDENPDATFGDVVEHLVKHTPERVSHHLDMMDASVGGDEPTHGDGIVFGYFEGQVADDPDPVDFQKIAEW